MFSLAMGMTMMVVVMMIMKMDGLEDDPDVIMKV